MDTPAGASLGPAWHGTARTHIGGDVLDALTAIDIAANARAPSPTRQPDRRGPSVIATPAQLGRQSFRRTVARPFAQRSPLRGRSQ
jgi:hypothetical protein